MNANGSRYVPACARPFGRAGLPWLGVAHVELGATVARLCRDGAVDERTRDSLLDRVDADFAAFDVVEWRGAVPASARALLVRHALRALDVVQLASALALRSRPLRFWCADARLANAAVAEGLGSSGPG